MPDKDNKKEPEYRVEESENFLSLYIGGSKKESPKKQEKDKRSIAVLTELLMQKGNSQLKVDALRELKTEAGKELLVKAIAVSKDKEKTRVLTAACWETGMDFSRFVSFFAQLAAISDFDICLEVLTVMEDMQGPFEKSALDAALKTLEDAVKKDNGPERSGLYRDMLTALKERAE